MTIIFSKKYTKQLILPNGDIKEKSVQYDLLHNESSKSFSVICNRKLLVEFKNFEKASKYIKMHFRKHHQDDKIECGFFNEGHIDQSKTSKESGNIISRFFSRLNLAIRN